jgi:superfamily II DNA or RNA helicase
MNLSLADRYNRFQADAVKVIYEDFSAKPNGRYLLVIPTGGGKTYTAVKAINNLFETESLNSTKDRVLWTAHRTHLLEQAKDTFKEYAQSQPEKNSIISNIDFEMITKTRMVLNRPNKPKLVVIDEAHHVAASSYQAIFSDKNVGVLGLTATPTRHDGKPLEFERESYSIGFPDLIELGVILRPTIIPIEGESSGIKSLTNDSDLEQLNTTHRNKKIIDALLIRKDIFQKVVIYVGTKNHAKELWQQLLNSEVAGFYTSISYVVGDSNSRGEDRSAFLSKERKLDRSILINVDVLTEGYDDPSVNTIVMARPTSSKLVYMQAIGRAIRRNPLNDQKQAYIVEVVDNLPNIRYRIDNRWLYSELSDALEPAVEDREYDSQIDFKNKLESVYDSYDVPIDLRSYPDFINKNRYGLLLFKVYAGVKKDFHIPILIERDNRIQISNFFNYMSARLPYFVKKKYSTDAIYDMAPTEGIQVLRDPRFRTRIFEAMESSASQDPIKRDLYPWITYFSFKHRPSLPSFSEGVKEFLNDMVNAKEIQEKLLFSEYVPESYLVRFPLPLGSYLGRIVTSDEFDEIKKLIEQFIEIRTKHAGEDHRVNVSSFADRPNLPVEHSLISSIATIVRFQLVYGTKIAFGDQECLTYCPN